MREDIQTLVDTINALKEIVTTHIAETKIYRNDQIAKLTEHHHDLNGNGKIGLKTKVDRLERSEYVKNWIIGVIFTGFITLACGYLLK